jgi:hypothetical protein
MDAIGGLINYPRLEGLYAYLTQLTNVSLSGCTNLNYAALVGTSPTTSNANACFNDLALAQTNVSVIGANGAMCSDPQRTFFCPSGVVDGGSATARAALANKLWQISFFP